MSVDTKHPLYNERLEDWELVRDAYKGQRAVKEKGTIYLPPTAGMIRDGFPLTFTNTSTGSVTTVNQAAATPGWAAYLAYRRRAVFPDIISDAVEAHLGVLHNKPATIEVPEVMQPLLERLTLRKESAQMLLRRINEEQLITGRVGLVADLPADPTPQTLPHLALYHGEQIINWDQGRRDGLALENLNLVVLDESEWERTDNFQWEMKEKFRVMVLGDFEENEAEGVATYSVAVVRGGDSFSEADLMEPSFRGNRLEMIPFTFINTKDVVPDPDDPPLLGLANDAYTIYRGEADYRQSLFMQGQDTLVTIGANTLEEEAKPVGANASLDLPMGGDAKYIGVDSAGLPEQRMALENDYARAGQKGGQLMDSVSRERESGDALKIRVSARTATLKTIALSGAFGLEQSLRQIATWIGADPMQVNVVPNLDFVDDELSGKDLTDYMVAKQMGAPFSLQSIHKKMQDKGLTDMSLEEELDAIAEEEPTPGSQTAPEDLEDQEDEEDEEDDDNGEDADN